jgi:hypothetical protein
VAQHDYVIANGTGAAVRSDLNNALAAIVSQNSGATAPATTYAYQWWADTTTGLLKLRNAANNAWITLFQLDGEWSTLAVENGSAAAPSIYFKDSGTDTGIYSPGADQVAVATNGTQRLTVDTAATTSTLPVVHPLGAVGTPSITFTGDLNTGIWSPAADTIAFSEGGVEAMRIDSSGRVGIGTTATGAGRLTVQAVDDTATGGISLRGFNDGAGNGDRTVFIDALSQNANYRANINYSSWQHIFTTNNTERARIDSSGRLLVGTSSALTGERFRVANSGAGQNTAVFTFDSSDDRAAVITLHTGSSGATSRKHFEFLDGGGFSRGSISVTGSATAYNTSSDYRLKENVVPVTDGIARFKQLKPSRFNFIGKGNPTVDGFLAHEAQAVVPECVTGEKDAEDADGNPVYQGIDQSKLVPLLTAALQEAIGRIETLEAEVSALKGA